MNTVCCGFPGQQEATGAAEESHRPVHRGESRRPTSMVFVINGCDYPVIPSCSQLEVFNAAASPRLVTMANQVLTMNVTETVSGFKSTSSTLKKSMEFKLNEFNFVYNLQKNK